MAAAVSFDIVQEAAGVGRYQRGLLTLFGLVWAADAMQVLAIGFTAPAIAASFGLGVPQALQTGTVFFLGMLVGAALFGRLADRFGRRRVLMATIALDAVFGVASAFAPDFGWLLALRFLTGLGVGGTLPVDYAMMAEFLTPRRRGRWLVILEGFWAVGTVLLALVALFAQQFAGPIESWRIVFFLTGVPAVLGLVLRLFLPESPLFLHRAGRDREAHDVLRAVAAGNGRDPDTVPPIAPLADRSGRPGFAALFAPALRRRSILVLLVWLLVSSSYYGVFVWLPVRLAGEGFGFLRGHGFLVLVALAQVPGYALAAFGVERWGRRPTLIGFLIASALGCGLYALLEGGTGVALATLLMSFALLGTWGALYAFTPELYPTRLRATGMGSAGATARLGGLLAPSLLAPAMSASFEAALASFAALLLLAAVAAALIDVETRERALG